MVLSKTTSYAIRIMIFMASHEEKEFSALHLYEELKIPERYLRRLLTKLSKEGLIKSTQGRNGGYSLAKPTESIFLSDIIDTVEGIESLHFCILGVKDCRRVDKCVMHDMWGDVKAKMLSTFSTTSLNDLKERDID